MLTVFCNNRSPSLPTRVTATGPSWRVPRLAPVGWPGLMPTTELPVRGWEDAADVLPAEVYYRFVSVFV